MDKILRKIIASGLLLVIVLVMIGVVTYAWITYSIAPEVSGIQVSLAGSNTILIAPNQTQIVDGRIYHYPGKFSRNLNFNEHEQYDYLNELDGLAPVSTADGLHWFLPTYYDINDKAVINGEAVAGDIKPYDDFYLDTKLEYANLTDLDPAQQGNYVCLDFWVVSPTTNYYLRIAQGDETDGSFVMEIMKPAEDADGGYELVETLGSVSSSVRVGFLVNSDTVLDDTVMYYAESENYSSAYTSLRGNYQEIGGSILESSKNKFTIYEPNGDLHPDGSNGDYYETNPVAWGENGVFLADIRDNLTVQLTNNWYEGVNDKYYIQEAFKAATLGKKYSSLPHVEFAFYQQYLQGNLSAYVDKGNFVTSTTTLYDAMVGEKVPQSVMETIEQSGATEDITIVHLEKSIPQRIRMFIWIEGQDSDCASNLNNVSFALGLELAGSQIDDKTRKSDQ